MKYIMTLIFLSVLLLSCKDSLKCVSIGALASKTGDTRCLKLQDEAHKKATEAGVCYSGPLLKGVDPGAIDPDPEKCDAIYAEAQKKCDSLPFDLKYIEAVSGSATYDKDGKLVMLDGQPICDSDK